MKLTYHIKLYAVLWAMMGIVCLVSAPAMAERDMGCSPTVANPCTGGTTGGGGYTAPNYDYEAVRLNELSERFNILLNELRRYPVPNIGDLYTAVAPATLDELSWRVDRLYVETAFHKSRRYWQYEENLRNLGRYPSVLANLRADIGRMETNLATAPERLRKAEAARDRNMAKAKEAERLAFMLRNNAEVVAADLATARGRALWPIYELLPADQKGAFHEGILKGGTHPMYARATLPVEPVVARGQIDPVVVRGQAANLIGPMHKPTPLGGTIEVRLQAFDDLKATLNYVGHLMPSQETRLAAFGAQAKELRRQEESLLARLQAYESPLGQAQALADDAEKRFLAEQVSQKVSAATLLRLAAATVVWDHVKTSVVVPRIEQVLKQNGLLKGVKGVALLDQIRKRPQDFLPKAGPLKDLPRLIETAKKVLSVEENLESFALAAAHASGQRSTADSDLLAAHVFASLGKQGADIMRTASNGMDGPFGKIAQVLMERAP